MPSTVVPLTETYMSNPYTHLFYILYAIPPCIFFIITYPGYYIHEQLAEIPVDILSLYLLCYAMLNA